MFSKQIIHELHLQSKFDNVLYPGKYGWSFELILFCADIGINLHVYSGYLPRQNLVEMARS